MESRKKQITNYLRENYSTKSKHEILNDLKLSWSYIQKIACLSGLKKGNNENKCDGSCTKILDYNNNITCYWLGFLLADGHLGKNFNIRLNISIKDKDHISKIQDHIGRGKIYKNESVITLILSDKKTFRKLANDFNWTPNKTKNPPTIPKSIIGDQLFSLIIGFIDGDGTISKKSNNYICVTCDGSWKNIINYFYIVLTKETKIFPLMKNGLCRFYFGKHKLMKSIKDRAIRLKLPILNRKWDRIMDNRILKQDKLGIIKKLIQENQTQEDILKQTNFSISSFYKAKRDLKKEICRDEGNTTKGIICSYFTIKRN